MNRHAGRASVIAAGFGVAAWLGAPAPRALAEQRYAVKELPNLPGGECNPVAINDRGHVVGYSDSHPNDLGFHWSEEGGTIAILSDWDGDCYPRSMNENGVVVGTLVERTGLSETRHAFLWRDGAWAKLDNLVDPDSGWHFEEAYDVNEAGQIVGLGDRGGYLLNPAEPYFEVVDLHSLVGVACVPRALSDGGAIAGMMYLRNDVRPFLWENGRRHDLGSFGGTRGEALDINERLQVVGYSNTHRTTGRPHAFLWESGVMVDLGTLGGDDSRAHSINDKGLILGNADPPGEISSVACVWENLTPRAVSDGLPCGFTGDLSGSTCNMNNAGETAFDGDRDDVYLSWKLIPQPPALHSIEVSVFRESTISVVVESSLPEGAFIGVRLDDKDCRGVIIDNQGRARTRWTNQSGSHMVCVDGSEEFCALAECGERPQNLVITELPPLPGGANTMATDINDDGSVVGNSEYWNHGEASHAVIWMGGEVFDLGTLGGEYSVANAIHHDGWAVGQAERPDGVMAPCIWRDGSLEVLPGLDGRYGGATAVNDRGRIAGNVSEGFRIVAVIWENGEIEPLPCPEDSRNCHARNVNGKGDVVGDWYDDSYRDYPFRWTSEGGMETLPTAGGDSNYASGINDKGIVVGGVYLDSVHWMPALWDADNKLTILPTPLSRGGAAVDINEGGDVVGWASYGDGFTQYAALWRGGEFLDLNVHVYPGCVWDYLARADGINNVGQIIGRGYIGNMPRSFVLTPAYPGNIKALSARCKRGDVVVRVKTWLPERTVVTAAADTGQSDCLTVDAGGRAKTRLLGAAGATRVCLREYEDLCEPMNCP